MIIRNAFLSIKKNIGKTLMIFILMALIANLVLAGFSIKSAISKSMTSIRQSMGATATLSYNMQSLMKNRKKGASMESVMKSISTKTADQLKNLKYVSSYNYSVSVGVNSSKIDPVKVSSSSSNDTNSNTPPNMNQSDSSKKNVESTDFTVSGNTAMSKVSSFRNKNYVLKTGRLLTSKDNGTNNCVISSTLASDNNLKVGSTFTVYATTSSGKKIKKKLTVVGIYKIATTSMSMDNMSNRQNPYNTIYTSLKTAQQLNNSTSTISSAVYYLDDPAHVSAFVALAKKTSINWNTYALQTSDEAYEMSVSSLSNMEKFANIFLVIVIVAGAAILALILMLTLRSRFYEFGVFLSLGQSKLKILGQQFMEIALIAVVAFILSMGTGKMVSNSISSMLSSATTSTQATAKSNQTNGPRQMMRSAMNSPKNQKLDVSVTPQVAGEVAGVTLAICAISVILPGIYILRLSPREILLRKEG